MTIKTRITLTEVMKKIVMTTQLSTFHHMHHGNGNILVLIKCVSTYRNANKCILHISNFSSACFTLMEQLTVWYFPRFNYGIIINTDIEGDNLRRELVDIVQVRK